MNQTSRGTGRGNVVRTLPSHLTRHGWTIETTADTEVVKGYPSELYERGPKKGQQKRTNPRTQARHWFAEALFTALLRQSEHSDCHVATAFPGFGVYRKLVERISEAIEKLDLIVVIVRESGAVEADRGRSEIIERSGMNPTD